MSCFEDPNYTMTPNELFDLLMRDMGMAELKVVLAVIRGTFGYHRGGFKLSLKKMAELTGMQENSVIEGAEKAEARGLIERITDGKRSTVWVAKTTSATEAVYTNTTSATEAVLPQLVRQKTKTTSATEGQLGLNKDSIKDNSKEKLTNGQQFFLTTFNAKRFANLVQAQAVLDLEDKYGFETLQQGVNWAATNGMSMGKAIASLKTALPKWGAPKKNGNGNGHGAEPAAFPAIRAFMEKHNDDIQ